MATQFELPKKEYCASHRSQKIKFLKCLFAFGKDHKYKRMRSYLVEYINRNDENFFEHLIIQKMSYVFIIVVLTANETQWPRSILLNHRFQKNLNSSLKKKTDGYGVLRCIGNISDGIFIERWNNNYWWSHWNVKQKKSIQEEITLWKRETDAWQCNLTFSRKNISGEYGNIHHKALIWYHKIFSWKKIKELEELIFIVRRSWKRSYWVLWRKMCYTFPRWQLLLRYKKIVNFNGDYVKIRKIYLIYYIKILKR